MDAAIEDVLELAVILHRLTRLFVKNLPDVSKPPPG